MKKLISTLEESILQEVIKSNYDKYPYLKEHIPFLEVAYREKTGVGMYIHFEYSNQDLPFNFFDDVNLFLSSNKTLEVDNLLYGLNYELNISNGKVDFLELVTNGEDWDGSFESFKLVEE